MPKKKLTDLTVKALPLPTTGQVDWWDTEMKSFGCRCSQGGTKTFILKQQNRRLTIGRYPYITLQQTRNEARRKIALKYIPAAAMPTQDAVQLYLENRKSHYKPRTHYQVAWNLKTYFAFQKPLHTITAHDLTRIIEPLSPSAGNHAFNIMKTFLNWCVSRQYIETNPIAGTKQPFKEKARDRLLTDEEVRLIWQESYNHNSFGVIVRLLLLTGQRLNQVTSLQAKWLARQTIVFPANIMKGNSEHVIPLASHAMRTIQAHIASQSGTQGINNFPSPHSTMPYLFPNHTGDKPFSNLSTSMAKFRTALPVAHFTLHDFRRYVSSTMSKLKVPIDITEMLLAHTTGSRSTIQRIYDRDARVPQMREALERLEHHLFSSVLSGTNSGGDTR